MGKLLEHPTAKRVLRDQRIVESAPRDRRDAPLSPWLLAGILIVALMLAAAIDQVGARMGW